MQIMLATQNMEESRGNTKPALSFGPTGLVTSGLAGSNMEDVYIFQFKHFVDNPLVRNLVTSSVEIFCTARKHFRNAKNAPVSSSIIAKLSQSYRAGINELINSLRLTDERDQDSADLGQLYSYLECVWQFCEIMFITSHPELPILPYYMDWIGHNFDTTEDVIVTLVPDLPDLDPENLKKLWGVINTHTFHGRTQDAAKLLEYLNPEKSVVLSQQLELMSELMRKKPVFDPTASTTAEFGILWNEWHEECENRLRSRAFAGSNELTLLAKVLRGDPEGFLEAGKYLTTWYEYLAMMLNYQYPLIRPASLRAYARKAIDEFGEFNIILSPIDEIILSAMDYDIVSVLKDMQSHWNHPWFPLHFSDLVYIGGIYSSVADSRIDYKAVAPIRHDFVREYGIDLMEHPALWEIGVKYLEGIPNHIGLPIIAELIQRKRITSDFEADKVIRVAQQFGFSKEIHGICREIGLRKFRDGQLQNALLWSIRAEDGALISVIVDEIIQDGNLEIVPTLIQLMPNFSACGEKLLFLNGFCEFSKLMLNQEFSEAMVVLCQLIEQQLIPKKSGAQLLMSLFVIRDNEVKLRPAEISIIMQFLHTKVGEAALGKSIFQELNQILVANRALDILHTFREMRKGTRTVSGSIEKVK